MSSPGAGVSFSGDLLASEDASRLARRRYADIEWMGPGRGDGEDLRGRGKLDEAMRRIQAKFEEINSGGGSAKQEANSSPMSPTSTSSGGSSSTALSIHVGLPDPLSAYPAPPPVPVLDVPRDLGLRVRGLQSYLRAFEYCHLGHEFHGVSKERSFAAVMKQAREMMREALPIKCLEAVALATLVTKDWKEVERLPLRFKTRSGGHSYWHIVLAITDGTRFGSVGLSRRCTLDFRPLNYPSLSSLVESFRMAYEEVAHEIHTITVGLPMPRKEYSPERIHWHFLQLPVLQASTRSVSNANKDAEAVRKEWLAIQETIDRYWKLSTKLFELVRKHTLASSTSSSSYTASLFIPPAALKALGTIHERIAYDSAEVALVYRPSWMSPVSLVHTSSTLAKPDAPVPKCVMSDNDSSGSSSSNSSSDSEGEEPAGSPGGAVPPRRDEEKTVVPLSPLPSSTAKSPATMRRIAERAERRRAKQLVESLRDKHRLPLHSPSSAGALAHSPAPKKRLSGVMGKPAASPARSPEKSGMGRKSTTPGPPPASSSAAASPQHMSSPAAPSPHQQRTLAFSPPPVALVRPARTLAPPPSSFPSTSSSSSSSVVSVGNHTPRLGPEAPLHSSRRGSASPGSIASQARTADPASSRSRIDGAGATATTATIHRASTSHGGPLGTTATSARRTTPVTARGDGTPRTEEHHTRSTAERPPSVPLVISYQPPTNSFRRPTTSSSMVGITPPVLSSARSFPSASLPPTPLIPLAVVGASRPHSRAARSRGSFSVALGVKLPEWEQEMWNEVEKDEHDHSQTSSGEEER